MSSRQRRRRQTKRRPEKQKQRGFCRAQKYGSRSTVNSGTSGACTVISDKLAALKSLIPTQDSEILKSDQLFQETANYIVRLKAQVFVLQKLVDFYASNDQIHVFST